MSFHQRGQVWIGSVTIEANARAGLIDEIVVAFEAVLVDVARVCEVDDQGVSRGRPNPLGIVVSCDSMIGAQ